MIPVLPLRDIVVFPHMVVPLFVGRLSSVNALQRAMDADKKILLLTQKDASNDNPEIKDIYSIGTVSSILQQLKLPDNTVKVLVAGGQRVEVDKFIEEEDCLLAEYTSLPDVIEDQEQLDKLVKIAHERFSHYVKLSEKVPSEITALLKNINDPSRTVDTIAANINIRIDQKQKILATVDLNERFKELLTCIELELSLTQIDKRIRGRVKQQMEKNQREYYLNEKIKAIHKELGDNDESQKEIDDLSERIQKAGMPSSVEKKSLSELNKLKTMSSMSAEATVIRNYLDWLLAVPWKKRSRLRYDMDVAEKVLEADHYGLEKVKERILEYLAVQSRVRKLNGPILCLVGPPGVGKTSLGQSIARATQRKFTRMSLGGLRDEAEIRGHRRTYIGALPGKIIQNISKVETRNPLFLLDEIDKMAMDFRGDPASALLEVLDPEQNHRFNDHYLEVDYDLSDVMFVATANTTDIPHALLDRMEVIRLSGYTEDEKLNIAMRYLVPKQYKKSGIKDGELTISESAILDIIRYYTREAGVRNIDRELAKISRKVVRQFVSDEKQRKKNNKEKVKTKKVSNKVLINAEDLEKHIGIKRYHFKSAEKDNRVGQINGLAWTEVGGDLLSIEVAVVPGKGKPVYTGQLGSVMQESIQAAITVVRSRSAMLGITPDFYQTNDIHVHVPEGATPKDGPSAGISMCCAMVSALTGIESRSNVAMTGEITLRGEILPIGGLKEKLIAARRGGIAVVLIPEENARDLGEIPDNVKADLDIRTVNWIEQVWTHALVKMPKSCATDQVPLEVPLLPAVDSATTKEQNKTSITH